MFGLQASEDELVNRSQGPLGVFGRRRFRALVSERSPWWHEGPVSLPLRTLLDPLTQNLKMRWV
jgi:hypothetical protein